MLTGSSWKLTAVNMKIVIINREAIDIERRVLVALCWYRAQVLTRHLLPDEAIRIAGYDEIL